MHVVYMQRNPNTNNIVSNTIKMQTVRSIKPTKSQKSLSKNIPKGSNTPKNN